MIDYVINILINQKKNIYFLQTLKIVPQFKTAKNSTLVEGLSKSYAEVHQGAPLMGAY